MQHILNPLLYVQTHFYELKLSLANKENLFVLLNRFSYFMPISFHTIRIKLSGYSLEILSFFER